MAIYEKNFIFQQYALEKHVNRRICRLHPHSWLKMSSSRIQKAMAHFPQVMQVTLYRILFRGSERHA